MIELSRPVFKVAKVLLAGAVIALGCAALPGGSASAQSASTVVKQATIQAVAVGVGMSIPVELPQDAHDVIIADPKTANAIVRSTRQAFVIGVAAGQTNIFFLDGNGRQILGLAVNVGRDLTFLRSTLRQMAPDADIQLESLQGSIVVRGSVATADDAARIMDVASSMINVGPTEKSGTRVVNAMTIRGKDQVFLKVTVAEIQRTATKQLGVDLSAASSAADGFSFSTTGKNAFAVSSTSPSSSWTAGFQSGGNSYSATLKLLEQQGLLRTLAEPTLTAISGEQAKFLAGGEFPVPTAKDSQGNVTYTFKQFGVSLAFSPTVLTEGRISLRVGTEVSELSTEGAISVGSFTISALKTRRADTTVELPSGGSMVIAGLLQEQTRQAISGQPGLMNLPILGALFRSRDYVRGQTEVVIIVTPYLVNPVSANKLKRPDDNFRPPSDRSGYLLGQLNSIYGSGGTTGNAYNGPVGFNRD